MGRPQIILTSTKKTASFTVFVVCGWREEAVAGVCLRTYLVHSTYVFLVMYQGYDILFYREAHCTSNNNNNSTNHKSASSFSSESSSNKIVLTPGEKVVATNRLFF